MFKAASTVPALLEELRDFSQFGTATRAEQLHAPDGSRVPVFINEFWTAQQRAAHSLHEISYRACFKPVLPRFFIERLTEPGDRVYDPFMGRGTTLLEAALLGRRVAGCDVNPLCRALVAPRLDPPSLTAIAERLAAIPLEWGGEVWGELGVFFEARTLREITALREYFLQRAATGSLDHVDQWIRMVALSRLTGHSKGFFSVYTLPPNQAVTIQSQERINRQRNQTPDYRDVRALIWKKSKQLLADGVPLGSRLAGDGQLLTGSCDATPQLADGSVDLVVTSPPFLAVVDYVTDNWMRGWFCGIDPRTVSIWQLKKIDDWSAAMTRALAELYRVVRPGGAVAFEVGEVDKGRVRLEENVLAIGAHAGFTPVLVLIHAQEFTKTANCWGVTNDAKGTNTNRVVVFQKPAGAA